MQCTKIFYSDLSHSNYTSSLQYYFITSSFKDTSVSLCVMDVYRYTYMCMCMHTHTYNLQRHIKYFVLFFIWVNRSTPSVFHLG